MLLKDLVTSEWAKYTLNPVNHRACDELGLKKRQLERFYFK